MSNRFFIIGSALIILLLTFNIYYDSKSSVVQKQSSGDAEIGGDFTLINQKGEVVKDSDFRGKLMLVFFGYSNCPAICPTDLAVISTVMKKLGDDADKVAPVFITVDPERDTVEQLSAYMQNFHPSINALTGTMEQTKAAAEGYKVYARKVKNEMMEEYMFDHSAYTYLMGKDGKYITHFAHNTSPDKMLATVKENL